MQQFGKTTIFCAEKALRDSNYPKSCRFIFSQITNRLIISAPYLTSRGRHFCYSESIFTLHQLYREKIRLKTDMNGKTQRHGEVEDGEETGDCKDREKLNSQLLWRIRRH